MQVEMEYMEQYERGEAPSLEQLVERYPDLREELAEFVFDFVSLYRSSDSAEPSEEALRQAAVTREEALERVFHHPESLREAREAGGEKLKTLAPIVGLPADVLRALEQGMIMVDTVPQKLTERLGSALGLPEWRLQELLAAPPSRPQAVHFRARGPEEAQPEEDPHLHQMSFEKALRASPECNEELLEEWLSEGDGEAGR